MGLKKGQTNNKAGRPKGLEDKRTSGLLEIWDELNYCPGREVIKLLKSGTLAPEVAINAHLKLMKFKFPELKAVEHSVSDETFEKALSYEEYLKTLK